MLAVIAIDTGVVESVLTLTPGLCDQRLGQTGLHGLALGQALA